MGKAGTHISVAPAAARWTLAFAREALNMVCREQLPRFLLGAERRGSPDVRLDANHRVGGVAKSVLEVSSPVAKASAAALISDCACARATALRAVASPVCAEVASVNVPTPCA